MMFKGLLRRRKRKIPPPEDQDGLVGLVRSDQDTEIRLEACRRIEGLPELRDLASSAPGVRVREIALARYRSLLCEQQGVGPALAERLSELSRLADQRILEQVALNGKDPESRSAAIAKVADPMLLAKCALKDSLAANRRAAVERLGDKSALEYLVKNIGKKDKRVYRAARDRLREITERQAQPERVRIQCEDLCEKLERLGRFGRWVQDRAMLDVLDRQWARIEPEVDQQSRAGYRQLRERFLDAYAQYRREHEAQIAAEEALEALRAERRALLQELQGLASLAEEAKVAQGVARIVARWEALPPLPPQEQAPLERGYAESRRLIAEHLQEWAAIRQRNAQLRDLVEQGEQAVVQSRPLDRKRIRGLMQQIKPLLEAKGADRPMAERYARVREALDERLRKQSRHAERRLEQLPKTLDELTGAVEQGILKEAEPLYQSLVAGIELIELSGLPARAYKPEAERLRALTPRMRELQTWRKWGTDQHREGLCVAMEELVAEDIGLAAIAERMRDLQRQWKGLDKGGSPVNHPLWGRFRAASERVYERCKPYLDAQAGEREENRRQRERLCEDLESFLDQVDWERMDWKKAVRAESEMRRTWSSLGPVDGRHRKDLERRYRAAMNRLEKHLAEERGRNQAHKRELIAQIEALVAEPDLGRAIEQTKILQRQWHTTVAARQREENRLWQRLRAASDAVFARRKEQQQAQAAELTENLRRREELCREAETLAKSDLSGDELTSALRELDRHWRELQSLPVPRQATPGLAERWRGARRLVEQRHRQALEQRRRRELELLATKAALCERLERILEGDAEPADVASPLQAQWRALPEQRDGPLQSAIERRFNTALEAVVQGGEAGQNWGSAVVANGERRAALCLQLEILAQIDSPPEFTQERLQLQVTRLSEHMREGEKDPLEATSGLLEQWYLCGAAPASQAPELEERFRRARHAIEAAGRDSGEAA